MTDSHTDARTARFSAFPFTTRDGNNSQERS